MTGFAKTDCIVTFCVSKKINLNIQGTVILLCLIVAVL